MAMLLSGTATIIIMKIGLCCSKAFLKYICEQVEHFNLGVSKKILQFENFNTTASGDSLEIKYSDLEDLFVENDKIDSDPIPIEHAVQFT